MNIKIQGGGDGKYANNGSCTAAVTYLQHEDLNRAGERGSISHFFNEGRDQVSSKEVTYKIDHNTGQLHRTDARFFIITVSPSQDEIKSMGRSEQSQENAFKHYIRNQVMSLYADNFNRNMMSKDVMYYAKIHHARGEKEGEQMHAHIIVSRKCQDNRLKLSPMTKHRNTSKGAVKGGFERTNFFRLAEQKFDKQFGYERKANESFDYCNAIKNGSITDIKIQVQKAAAKEQTYNKSKNKSTSKEFEL